MAYDPDFLGGDPVPLPTLSHRLVGDSFDGGSPIHHERFSLVFHASRGLAIYAAHNVDGSTMIPEGTIPRRDRFRLDEQVDADLQIDNDRGYVNNPWDRGHLARRRSLHWGDVDRAREADRQSYVWTNIAPQHERLHDTAWGPIEDWILDRTESGRQRAAVFTGPVMTPEDPLHRNGPDQEPIRIPAGFWKVVVVPVDGRRTAAAFLVWQRDHDSEFPVSFSPFLEQVRVTTIEFLTGLSFADARHLDPLRFGPRMPRDLVADRAVPPRPGPVTSPGDVVL